MARTKKTQMNKWEREVQASLFSSEEDALKALEQGYKRTLQSIMDQVKLFDADIKMLDDAIADAGGTDEALMSQRQSKAYQRQFQKNLQAQIEAILDKLQSDEYNTINDYLNGCYKDAFVGSEYALAMQGVPVITPVRPEAVTKAVLLDSKVVNGYYARIGIDIAKLKQKIASEITRGIASAMSYADIARNLDAVSGSGLYNAKRIVRTEGHRIQQAAWMDSAEDAKAHGADLVRIWSSTLDGRTRETHRMYDGETAEVGGKFKLNGRDVDAPGYFGIPSEDCNCRCVAFSRPRWALNDPVRKNDGFNGKIREFDTPDDYEDFKEKYWGKDNTTYMDYLSQLEQKYGTNDYQTLLGRLSNKEYTKLNRLENASPMWKPQEKVFVPFDNAEDAKQYLADIIADNVDFGKMTIDQINGAASAITEMHNEFPSLRIDTIGTSKRKNTIAQASGNTLKFNASHFGAVEGSKNFDLNIVFAKSKIAQLREQLDTGIMYGRKIAPQMRKKLESELARNEYIVKFKRFSTYVTSGKEDRYRYGVFHEFGHIVSDRYLGMINGSAYCPYYGTYTEDGNKAKELIALNKSCYKKAVEDGTIFDVGKYGSTDEYEFFSEVFCMHYAGETLPDYIEDMIREVISFAKVH